VEDVRTIIANPKGQIYIPEIDAYRLNLINFNILKNLASCKKGQNEIK